MDINPFSVLMLSGGILIFVIGLIDTHHADHKSPWYIRLGCVSTTIIGLVICWASIASSFPVIINTTSRLESYHDGFLVAEVKYDKVRKCKLSAFRGQFIKDNMIYLIDKGAFYVVKPLQGSDEKEETIKLVIRNTDIPVADKLALSFEYTCPFGFKLTSEFPSLKLDILQQNPQIPKVVF